MSGSGGGGGGGFRKAQRKKAKLRLAMDGSPGSGKSLSALRFAFAFGGGKVAAIEAGENGGLELYQGLEYDGVRFDFDIMELKGNFAPSEYTAAIREAGRLGCYDVLIIDSLSHAWAGAGGALDQVGRVSQGARFTSDDGWRKVTPQHNAMIDAILQSPCHVICTMRSKVEYVLEDVPDPRTGKVSKVPRKVGLAPIQRAGMEYEFTIYGSFDFQHNLTVTKSRCPLVQDAVVHMPGAAFMRPVIAWLELGDQAPPPAPGEEIQRRASAAQAEALRQLTAEARALGMNEAAASAKLRANYGTDDLSSLTGQQAAEVEAKLRAFVEKKRKAAATPPPPPPPPEEVSGDGDSQRQQQQ